MEKKNRNTTYFVPLISDVIGITVYHLDMIANTYFYDLNKPDYNSDKFEGLFVQFKWKDPLFEQKLIDNPYVLEHYDIDQETFMVYIKFPDQIIKDCQLLYDSKFSQISQSSKAKIIKFWPGMNMNHPIYCILNKTDNYRQKLMKELDVVISPDMELGDKFNIHKESYINKV